jgi:hypothetical protein
MDKQMQEKNCVHEAEAATLRKQVKDLCAKTAIAENKHRESQNTITTLQVKIFFIIIIKIQKIQNTILKA